MPFGPPSEQPSLLNSLGTKGADYLSALPTPQQRGAPLDDSSIRRRSLMHTVSELPYTKVPEDSSMLDEAFRNIKVMEEIIRTSGDTVLREQANTKAVEEEATAYSRIAAAPSTDQGERMASYQLLQRVYDEAFQKREAMASERRFVEAKTALLASGKRSEAAMLDTMYHTPDAYSWRAQRLADREYMRKALEETMPEEKDRNFFFHAVDFLMFGIPLLEGTSYLGNVDTGNVEKGMFDWVLPGQRLRNEAYAFDQIMNIRDPAERAAALDQVAKNMAANAKDFGYRNQLLEGLIRSAIINKAPSADETNFWAAIDVASAPFAAIDAINFAKGSAAATRSIPKVLQRAGLNADAANVTKDVAARIKEKGAGAAFEETGVSLEDVEDASLPSGLNPNATPGEVSLAGRVLDGPSDPKEVAKEMFGGLPTLERLSEEEWSAAELAYKARLKKDFKQHIHDVQFDQIRLTSGSTVRSPVVTFGTTDGGLFVNKIQAEKSAERLGLSSTVVVDVPTESGLFYAIEARLPISESGYYSVIKDTKSKNFLWRFLLGSRQTTSDEIYGLGVAVGAKQQKIVTTLEKDLSPVLGSLNNNQKQKLVDILVKSRKDRKWYDSKELDMLWARQMGIGDDIPEITDTEIRLGNIASPAGDPEFLSQKAFLDLKDRSAALGKQADDLFRASGEADEATFWANASDADKAIMDELTAVNAQIAKGPQPVNIDTFLEPHTYKEWRAKDPAQFPPEHEAIWKALDEAADQALANQAKAGEQAMRSTRRAAEVAQVAEIRAADPYLDEFFELFRGGPYLSERSAIPGMNSTPVYAFPGREDIIKLADLTQPTGDPTTAPGIRGLEFPGKRFVLWPAHLDYHEVVFQALLDIMEESGLPKIPLEDVKSITIPVNVNKKGAGRFGKVVFDEYTGEGGKPVRTEMAYGDFARQAETYKATGSLMDKRVRDAETKANSAMENAMTGGTVTEEFRAATDRALSLVDTKYLRNAEGQILHTNRQKIMTKPMEWSEEIAGLMPQKIKTAYYKLVDYSNVEHLLRNDEAYLAKATRGFSTVSLLYQGRPFIEDVDGIVYRAGSLPAVPSSRVYNISDDIHYVAKTEEGVKDNIGLRLTQSDISRMLKKEGYIMVRLDQPVEIGNRVTVQWVIGKQTDFEVKPLKFNQIGYIEGGHVGYTDKHFAKQVSIGRQGDNGEVYLRNPHTFMVGTEAEVKEWARIMEQARLIWNNTDDATRRMEQLANHLDHRTGYPSADEFALMIKNNQFDPEYPVEALYDREHPSDYAKIRTQGWDDMSDPEESGTNTYMQTHGRMYTSPRGQQLNDWRGQEADIIDPFEMMNKAVNNIASLSSLGDFKMRSIEKWITTFGPYLDLRGIPRDASPVRIFQESVFLNDLPAAQKIKNSAEAQRDTIKRILGWRSDIDREFEYMGRQLVSFVAGDKPGKWNKSMARGLEWAKEKDPIARARKAAFHMYLGLGSIPQFLTQVSTMLAAISIEPRSGMHAFAGVLPLRLGIGLKGKTADAWVDFWLKAGWGKMAGYDNPEDFKTMMRAGMNSGWFDIGGTHTLINYEGVSANLGRVGKGVSGEVLDTTGKVGKKALDWGTIPFNEAELWNRMVGWQIAWRDAKKMNLIPGTSKHTEFLMKKADDYTFNMTRAGQAAWQRGLASVPTQFLSFQARMLEAMLGKQFTTAQKIRLVLGQTLFYGTAGPPLLSFIIDLFNGEQGEAGEIGTWQGLMERGIIDTMISSVTGLDISYTERVATGGFISDTFRELFGMSRYGEVSFVDIMGGPLWALTKDTTDAGTKLFWTVAKAVSAESGGDTGLAMTADSVVQMARNVASFNTAYKAYMVWNYGQFVTKSDKVVLDELPSEYAFAILLGLTPGEYRDYAVKQDWRKNRKAVVQDVADEILSLRQRLVREVSNSDAIISQIEVLRATTPRDVWADALDVAGRAKAGESIYDGLARRYEQDRQQQRNAEAQ